MLRAADTDNEQRYQGPSAPSYDNDRAIMVLIFGSVAVVLCLIFTSILKCLCRRKLPLRVATAPPEEKAGDEEDGAQREEASLLDGEELK